MFSNTRKPTEDKQPTQPGPIPTPHSVKLPELPPIPPVVTEAQRVAAETSVSGRKAVSRGSILMAFYLWLLSGAVMLSLIARRTDFFPGDRSITARLQSWRQPWVKRFFFSVSEVGFPKFSIPQTIGIAGIFWALRFRLEAIFVVLTSSTTIINMIIKSIIKRPRPTKDLVTVARVIDEPSFPSGHVMHYTNFYGLLIYLLATNWKSGRIRNGLITTCLALIGFIGPSRIYLGAHWPSDVLAGYVYGGLWFGGFMSLYLRIKAWIHPKGKKAPAVAEQFKQPGIEDDDNDD